MNSNEIGLKNITPKQPIKTIDDKNIARAAIQTEALIKNITPKRTRKTMDEKIDEAKRKLKELNRQKKESLKPKKVIKKTILLDRHNESLYKLMIDIVHAADVNNCSHKDIVKSLAVELRAGIKGKDKGSIAYEVSFGPGAEGKSKDKLNYLKVIQKIDKNSIILL